MTYTTGNNIADQIAEIQITGNVTPATWYKTIVGDTGKPNLIAIALLSDFVYWYKPTEIRDEATGQIVGYKKKFKADLLQRSYGQMAEQFGISNGQATDAIKFLEKKGLVKRVFKTIFVGGVLCNNVLFIEIVPQKIKEFTFPTESVDNSTVCDTPPSKNQDRHPRKIETPSLEKKRHPPSKNRGTNTKTSTEITTKISDSIESYQEAEELFKNNIDYDAIRCDLDNDVRKQEIVDNFVQVASDTIMSTSEHIRVGKVDKPTKSVKDKILSLNMLHMKYIIDAFCYNTTRVRNIKQYMIACLYNADMTMSAAYTNQFEHDRGG